MKNGTILGAAFLLVSSMFANEAGQTKASLTSLNDFLNQNEEIFIPYVQMAVNEPGAGLLYRTKRGFAAFQIDGNALLNPFGTTLSLAFSSIMYPFANLKTGFAKLNLTAGMGVATSSFNWNYVRPYIPVSIGYQGNRIFFDAGYSIIPVFSQVREMDSEGQELEEKYVSVFAFPTLKVGLCF